MAKKDRYFRQNSPPPMGRVLHLIRVTDKERATLMVCSSEIFGTRTHYDTSRRRTVRCTKHQGQCTYCDDLKLAFRWVGFIHVIGADRKSQGLLELTHYAGEQLVKLVEEVGHLRGLCIHVFRERGNKKSPLVLEISRPFLEIAELPPPGRVEPTLDRLWGLAN